MTERDAAPLLSRRALESDAEAVSRVHFAAVRGTGSAFYPSDVLQHWSPEPSAARTEEFRRAILSGDELFVVVERAGSVVGFGSIVVTSSELRAVYVHPEAGRVGVGSKLLAELEALAVERGLGHLELSASLNAEKFYAKHGYEALGRHVHRLAPGVRLACWKMKKSLAPPAPVGPAQLLAVYPIGDTDPRALPARAIGPAVAFYTHVFGFTLVSKGSGAATLARDGVHIGLAVNGRDPEQASCYFEVSDVQALHRELSDKGVEPSAVREDRDSGGSRRVFFAAEPFGVCFCFGQASR